jgi:NAD(P) transhydrogenase subunit alpha
MMPYALLGPRSLNHYLLVLFSGLAFAVHSLEVRAQESAGGNDKIAASSVSSTDPAPTSSSTPTSSSSGPTSSSSGPTSSSPADADAAKPSESSVPAAETTTEEKPAAASDRVVVLIGSLTVFILAIFVGFEIINKVPPTLHTPLMSGSNAISGITIVGALLATGFAKIGFGSFFGMAAIVLAMINVAGGFWVTHRMLAMFKKK